MTNPTTNQMGIQVKSLSVSYGTKRVLTNIYLDILPSKIYGLIGPNGAGKSTLFKAILGLLEPNSGSILINGKNISKINKKVAYVPQRDDVDWSFPATATDIVLMGRYPHKKLFSTINQADRKIAQDAMQKLGITDLAKRQIGELSGGQQQRVFLARAIAQQADYYLLDEPFVGVDNTTEDHIIALLKDLAKKNKTILVVHHDLDTVPEYFDHVILLNQRLIASGPTLQTFIPENITKTYKSQLPILHKTGLIQVNNKTNPKSLF